jgi:steroid 5-alpha reductase family enzyme
MFDWTLYLYGLAVTVVLVLTTWVVSTVKRDVSIIDSTWSLMFLAMAFTYTSPAWLNGELSARAVLLLLLVSAWAMRLSIYISWRNWGEAEDRRYQAMRRKHEPGFALKSLYLVFGLQGLLAWIISLPLLAAASGSPQLGLFDVIAVAVWLVGFGFETVADAQLAAFRARPQNRDRVLDSGLWRYSRHPNYFGECAIWWGFYLLAVAAGGWWSFPASTCRRPATRGLVYERRRPAFGSVGLAVRSADDVSCQRLVEPGVAFRGISRRQADRVSHLQAERLRRHARAARRGALQRQAAGFQHI